MKTVIFTFTLSILCILAKTQPTNNPYQSMYGTDGKHWTDSLRWSSIYDVTSYGAIANDSIDDLSAVNAAIDAANGAGGGVVFFPAGTYNFSATLKLKSNVILRGADFTSSNAKTDEFAPLSKLEFPKYTPTFTGSGTDITSGFRAITNYSKDINNVGIVNLDINRARIELHPSFVYIGSNGGQGTEDNYQPVEKNRNCIIMGVRNNNTAIPDPGVPATGQELWQRFSWRFAANFDLFFAENVIVANCRLNDLSMKRMDDSYDQPGYKTTSGVVVPIDSLTRFNYAAHYGISVNRAKIIGSMDDKTITIKPFIWYPDPEQEPSLFAKGIEIRDNWVYKELRIAITASGLGLVIKGNIAKDKPNKIAYLKPDGKGQNTNYSATYENRGIDFSGWDVTVEDNNVEAFHLGWPGNAYKSIDGEGIMNQGNSGGSNVNGLILRNNTVNSISPNATNPAFSCYSMEEVFNVECKNNTFSGLNGYYLFSATKGAKILHNVIVDSNDIGSMNMSGVSGGSNNFARYNTRIGSDYGQVNTGKISSTCNVVVQDNTGFTINPCTDAPASLPGAIITYPTVDTIINTQTINIAINTDITADSIVIYNGPVRLPKVTPTSSIELVPLSLSLNTNFISAKVYKSGLFNYSPIRKITVTDLASDEKRRFENEFSFIVQPNPAKQHINIQTQSAVSEVLIYNLLGEKILEVRNNSRINVSTINPGVYLIRVIDINGKSGVQKIMKSL